MYFESQINYTSIAVDIQRSNRIVLLLRSSAQILSIYLSIYLYKQSKCDTWAFKIPSLTLVSSGLCGRILGRRICQPGFDPRSDNPTCPVTQKNCDTTKVSVCRWLYIYIYIYGACDKFFSGNYIRVKSGWLTHIHNTKLGFTYSPCKLTCYSRLFFLSKMLGKPLLFNKLYLI